MRELSGLSTVQEVDAFIDLEICRNLPLGFRTQVEAGNWSAEERSANPKLDAVCKALERRAELQREVSN